MARFDKSFRVMSPVGPVYRVNGAKVRKASVNGAAGWHRLAYPGLVPGKEVWLEKLVGGANEERFILAHEMTEILLMRLHGWKYPRAHAAANRAERALRNGAGAAGVFTRFIKRHFPRAQPDAVAAVSARLLHAYKAYR